MSYNENINYLRLNSSINYIINNQTIMFDMITSLRNSINNSNRARSVRPNYYSYRNTMPTTPSPPVPPFTMNSTSTPTSTQTTGTNQTPSVSRLRNIEISLTEPFHSQFFNSIFNPTDPEEQPLSLTQLLENTELSLYTTGEEDTMCTVCRLNIQDNSIIRKINGCGHKFHQSCLDNWLKNHHTCPICRHSLRNTPETTPTPIPGGSII